MSKPVNRKLSEDKFEHPEISTSEVFFTNSSADIFHSMGFKTKRRGNWAYDGRGNKLPPDTDWFPVFLQLAELHELDTSLSELRKQLRENQAHVNE